MTTPVREIHSLSDAIAFLNGKTRRKLAHNTYVERCDDGDARVLYHATYIATFRETFNEYTHGGWFTSTTKERLSWLLPREFRIYQERNEWWIAPRNDVCELCLASRSEHETRVAYTQHREALEWGEGYPPTRVRKDFSVERRYCNETSQTFSPLRYAFANGMRLYHNGDVEKHGGKGDARKRNLARITKFVDAFVDKLQKDEIDFPGNGDCLFCGIFHNASGNGDGDGAKATALNFNAHVDTMSHVVAHVKESYFVPSLLMNAARKYGAKVDQWDVQGAMARALLKRVAPSDLERAHEGKLALKLPSGATLADLEQAAARGPFGGNDFARVRKCLLKYVKAECGV